MHLLNVLHVKHDEVEYNVVIAAPCLYTNPYHVLHVKHSKGAYNVTYYIYQL